MPRSWYSHWPLADGTLVSAAEAAAAEPLRSAGSDVDSQERIIFDRENAICSIGNLTLIHLGVNRGLQNHGYREKREALFEHSNLQLNRALMRRDSWDEAAIAARGAGLFEFAVNIWRGPNSP